MADDTTEEEELKSEEKEEIVDTNPEQIPEAESPVPVVPEVQTESGPEPEQTELSHELPVEIVEPVATEPAKEELKEEPPVEVQKIGNQTTPTLQNPSLEVGEPTANVGFERKSDTVTITEAMSPPTNEVPKGAFDAKFPAPFIQKNLWQKFLEKTGLRKRKKLDKILEFLNTKTLRHSSGQMARITNDEVEKLLRVSDATATRYLDLLERENKIRQVGKTGRHTYYEKI